MTDDNVLLFPPERIVNPSKTRSGNRRAPKTIEEVKTNLKLVHHVYISELLESMIPTIISQLSAAGFDITDNGSVKDGAFLVEALRSLLCKQYGIDHPFQKLAEKIFIAEDDGNLRVVKKISVDLNVK